MTPHAAAADLDQLGRCSCRLKTMRHVLPPANVTGLRRPGSWSAPSGAASDDASIQAL